ncbi:putative efflux pump antibiotic resistance protein [Thozetella sp. PMI_491]|nr:putative efflux pump antibiotic resistance protein [Thozetella sp. PMI_491]
MSLIVSVLLFSMDNTIVADIQPSILDAFGNIDKLPWIGLGFQAGAMTVLPAGQAYGTFSVKTLFLASVILFEVGSAVCGGAPNMNAMIVGRVLTGVGGAATYCGGLTYITVLTTEHERPLYMAGIAVMYSVGSVIGPIVGGGFADSSATWRWAFYINLVIAAVLAPAFLWCLPRIDPMPSLRFVQKLRAQDWVGIVVYYGFTTCFTMAVTFGGAVYAWNSGSEITLWVMTGVLFAAFVLVTLYHPLVPAANKLYPVHLARRLELNNLQYQLFSAFGCLLITVYYTPLLFQFTRGDTPVEAGVRLLPIVCMVGFFSIVSGALMPKLGYHMPWYVFGNALVLAGSACMFTIDSHTPASRIYGYTVLIGIGIGCTVLAGFSVVQVMLPPSDANAAVGFMSFGQALGGIAVLGAAGSVFQNLATEYIAPLLPGASSAEIQAVMAGTNSAFFRGLDPALREQVVAAITRALSRTFAVNIAATAIAFVCSLFMSRKRLWT